MKNLNIFGQVKILSQYNQWTMESSGNPDLEKWNEISQLSESGMLPKLELPYAFDTEVENSQSNDQKTVVSTRAQTGQKLSGILTLLKSMYHGHGQDNENKSFGSMISPQRRKQLIPLISILGEQYSTTNSSHSCDNKPWTSNTNAKVVGEIIQELHRIFNLKNDAAGPMPLLLSKLFEEDFKTGINPNKTIFGQLLHLFRSKLVGQNEIWQYHPAAKASFHWVLLQVKYPYLSDFIPGSLQPALNFCDDFQTRNQFDALDCFDHVVENVVSYINSNSNHFKLTNFAMLLLLFDIILICFC
jgi:hypothetical protein